MSEDAGILDRLAGQASSWIDVSTAVDLEYRNSSSPFWEAMSWAFQYDLNWPASAAHLSSGYSPMVTYADGQSYPPAVRSTSDEVAQHWRDGLRARHAAVLSRLADLLVVRGAADRGKCLPIAIDAYLDMSQLEWDALDQSQAMGRALVLARGSNAAAKVDQIVVVIGSRLVHWLDHGEAPGVTIPLIEQLSELPAAADMVLDLIEHGMARYGDNPHDASALLMTKWALSSRADRREVGVERVRVWTRAAEAVDSMVKVLHLQSAVRLADDLGLEEERDRASTLLQEAGALGHDMEKVTSEVNLPRAAVDQYLTSFTASGSWRDNLDRFCMHAPVTGLIDRNRSQVVELAQVAPLSALFPRVRLGGDGLPRWTAESEDDLAEARLCQVEELNVQVGAPLLARGLSLVRTEEVTRDELEEYWSGHPNMDDRTAALLSQSLHFFWRGEGAVAAALSIPTIETLARSLVVSSGRGVYRVQREKKPGQYPGLGALVDFLVGLGWDESWARYVMTVFAGSRGMNLRNEWAHGFTGPLSDSVAAMAIHIAGHLSLLTAGETSTPSARPAPD